MANKERCESCKFVEIDSDYFRSDIYRCHRFPPIKNFTSVEVAPSHWCGEYKNAYSDSSDFINCSHCYGEYEPKENLGDGNKLKPVPPSEPPGTIVYRP